MTIDTEPSLPLPGEAVGLRNPGPEGDGKGEQIPRAQNRAPAAPFTCGGCDNTWTGQTFCHCKGCHRTFSGLGVFDEHRKGGDRCLDPTTITKTPGHQDARGIWRGPEISDEAKIKAGWKS